MEINYWAVLVCGVLAMGLGALWYGPLFGKKWMEIVGANASDMVARAEMQKNVWKLYVTNFVLVLFQAWVLAYYIGGWTDASGVTNALWIWAGFIMPTIAAGAMWNNDNAKVSWSRFLIQSGYQLVIFVIFGLVLGAWR
ncbi:MAG: DUF1761 domain-containing protein [Patescibacteria group bacterium]